MYRVSRISVSLCHGLLPLSHYIGAISVSLEELNPVKMGSLFAELVQKFMEKYSDYKYKNEVKSNGGFKMIFAKDMPSGLTDAISIESSVTGTNCQLFILYATNLTSDTPINNGISIEDI